MESAREEQQRWIQARVAWGVSALGCLSALPSPQIHSLALIAGYIGWFLHLLDVQLTAMEAGQPVSYTTGWTLLGAAAVSSLLRTGPSLWAVMLLWATLLGLVWRAWRDVRRVADGDSHPA